MKNKPIKLTNEKQVVELTRLLTNLENAEKQFKMFKDSLVIYLDRYDDCMRVDEPPPSEETAQIAKDHILEVFDKAAKEDGWIDGGYYPIEAIRKAIEET